MSVAKKLFANKEQAQHTKQFGLRTEINPLRDQKMTTWLKGCVSQANPKYTATFEEKKQLLELEELFQKFDEDGSGTLDLDELVAMFQMAGLRVQGKRLKDMFLSAKDVEIVNNELDCERFQKLMLSPILGEAFRKLLKEIRHRFKYNDYSMVDPEIGFLPTDLSMMLGYLYKRSIRKNLSDNIQTHLIESTQEISSTQLQDKILEDLDRFRGLFHLHDDASFDSELRQKYRVGPMEKKFRSEQNPQKRAQLEKMRAITTYFLKQIREKALSHKHVKGLVDESLLKQQPPSIAHDRQMKMRSDLDHVEISMANLHKIREDRRLLEEAKNKEAGKMTGIMRALTKTKQSSTNIHHISFAQDSNDDDMDLSKIQNQEERGLYEMLSCLNENLEILDEVKEVFDLAENSDEDVTNPHINIHQIEEEEFDYETAKRIVEDIPSPSSEKRVTKGKAVFITPDNSLRTSLAEQQARRNVAIAKLMLEQTQNLDSDSKKSQGDPSELDRSKNTRSILKNKTQALQNQELPPMKQQMPVKPVNRNASTGLHRSQLSQGLESSFNSVKFDGVRLQAQGRSVLNKRQRFNNPFKEQLDLDSKDLLSDLIKKNQDHRLTDFQTHTLRNMRNEQQRSKMIIYGDCVDQFERMVDRRQKLYSSMEGFKKVNMMGQSHPLTQGNSATRDINKDAAEESTLKHLLITVNEKDTSVVTSPVSKSTVNATTPAKNSDSLFSLQYQTEKDKSTRKDRLRNKDLQSELPELRQGSQTVLMPSHPNNSSSKKLQQSTNLLLMSQKVKIFASPAAKHTRQFKKQMTTSGAAGNGSILLSSKMAPSTDFVTQATDLGASYQENGEAQKAASYQVLPAINSNSQMTTGQRDVLYTSDPSEANISHLTSQLLQSNKQTMPGYQNLDEEPQMGQNNLCHDMRPKFKRNFTNAQSKSKNASKSHILLAKELRHRNQQFEKYRTKGDSDYNYAGYSTNKTGIQQSKREESFFNSKQQDRSEEILKKSHSAMLQRLVQGARKINKQHAKRADQGHHQTSVSPRQAVQKQQQPVVKRNQQKLVSGEFQLDAQSTIDNIDSSIQTMNVELSTKDLHMASDESLLAQSKQKKKRNKSLNKKSPRKSPKSKKNDSQHFESPRSVKKLNIVAPHVVIDLSNLSKKQQGRQKPADEIMLQAFPSLGASSLNRVSDIASSYNGQPTLAAAQARSMTRKVGIVPPPKPNPPYKIYPHNEDSQITGIIGDGYLLPGTTNLKENRLKLKKVKNDVSANSLIRSLEHQTPSPMPYSEVFTTEQSHPEKLGHLRPNYDNNSPVDEEISAQKSLRGASLMLDSNSYFANKKVNESLGSVDSERLAPPSLVASAKNLNAKYSGEIVPLKELPQSSMNVLNALNNAAALLLNKQDYPLGQEQRMMLANGVEVGPQSSPPDSAYNFKPKTKQTNYNPNLSYFTNFTNNSYKSTKVMPVQAKLAGTHETGFTSDDPANQDAEVSQIPLGEGDRQRAKVQTPFQKFQERMKQLELQPQTAFEYEDSLKTPMFNQANRKSTQKLQPINGGTALTNTNSSGVVNRLHNYSLKSSQQQQMSAEFQSATRMSRPKNMVGTSDQSSSQLHGLERPMQIHGKRDQAPIQVYQNDVMKPRQKDRHSQPPILDQSNGMFNNTRLSAGFQQAAHDRRVSKEELVSSIQESQMLSVTKINFVKNVTKGGKITSLDAPKIGEYSNKSLGQTDHIEGASKTMSRLYSINDNHSNSKKLNADLPKQVGRNDTQQPQKDDKIVSAYDTGFIGAEQVSLGSDTLTYGGGSKLTLGDIASHGNLQLTGDVSQKLPYTGGHKSKDNTPSGKVLPLDESNPVRNQLSAEGKSPRPSKEDIIKL